MMGIRLKMNKLHDAIGRRYGNAGRIHIVDRFLMPEWGFGGLTLVIKRDKKWWLVSVERFFGRIWVESVNNEIHEDEARYWLGETPAPLVNLR